MKTSSSLFFRLSTLAAAAILLNACQTPAEQPAKANANVASAAATIAASPILRQDAFKGIYEVSAAADGASVFVATISGFDKKNGGLIHRLDARSLQNIQTIQVPRRSYALGLNNTTNTLYVGNTMDGSLSVVDAGSGIVKAVIQLAQAQKNDKGEEYFAHTRKVIIDEAHNRIFVTSPGQPGLIWIVDGATNTLQHTITSDGVWSAGAAYSAQNNRLYVSQGGVNEILVIDPDAGKIVDAFSTGDTKSNEDSKHFFINLALDAKGQRLFATDPNTDQLYVADIASGKFITAIPTKQIGLLDIAYSAQRNEVIATSRGVTRQNPDGTGAVTVFDDTTFAIKQTYDLPAHPNSLAVSPDGQSIYVTVKAARGEKHPAARKDAQDSLVRIDRQ